VAPTSAGPLRCIVADTFERESGVVEALRARGVQVELRQLRVGDYELGAGVLVERKTVFDLHLSLERGRFWRQVGELRRAARLPYLLVEGLDLDRGSIPPAAIRGACLAVIGQGVPVLVSRDASDSAMWLRLLGMRIGDVALGRDRPAYTQRLKPPLELVSEAMLAAVPGISVVRARALLQRFGSVAAVASAGKDAWLEVPGIGPSTASALTRAFF
jgi:DNA excision repair protein ERCC-4